MGKQLRQSDLCPFGTSLRTCFSRFLLAGSLIVALGGCKAERAVELPKRPDAAVKAESPRFRESKKSLETLSIMEMFEIDHKLAVKETEKIGREFKDLLKKKGPAATARAYLDFNKELESFNSEMKENFNHALDLVNQVIYYAGEKGKMNEEVRLGCLLILLPEIPAIRRSVPKEQDIYDDAIYRRINFAMFLRVFSEDDGRFKQFESGLLLWATGSKKPHSKKELTRLFEMLEENLSRE